MAVPYAAHGLVAYEHPCVNSNATAFFSSLGTSYDTSCLDDLVPPDFDGSDSASQSTSLQYFNNSDLWGNGKVFDVAAASDDCKFTQSEVTNLILGITIPLSIIIIVQFLLICYFKNRVKKTTHDDLRKSDLTAPLL